MLRIELTQYETRGDFHVIFTFGGARQTTICAIVIIVREYKVPFIFPHFLEHVEIMRVRTKSSTLYTTGREGSARPLYIHR